MKQKNKPQLSNTCSLAALFLAVAGMFFLFCSSPITQADNGSGSGIGNGVVIGSVVCPETIPAEYAVVRLRTSGFLADTSGIITTFRNDTTATVHADSSGHFLIDSLDTARSYFIEVYDSRYKECGTIFRLPKLEKDTVVLSPRIMTPLKPLQGTILLSGLPVNAYVLIYGLERVGRTDSHGRFTITDLPTGNCSRGECEYKIRLIIPQNNTVKIVETELEIEYDSLGNIEEVELEIDD